ncbi:hypothetical protein ABID59_004551 [Bradyrhizobium sp. S3.3.6]
MHFAQLGEQSTNGPAKRDLDLSWTRDVLCWSWSLGQDSTRHWEGSLYPIWCLRMISAIVRHSRSCPGPADDVMICCSIIERDNEGMPAILALDGEERAFASVNVRDAA